MLDFLTISVNVEKGVAKVIPGFKTWPKSHDLMIRGGDFYAIWVERLGLWSPDEQDALQLMDQEIDEFVEKNKEKYSSYTIKVLHFWDARSKMIDEWHHFCKSQCRDNFHMLDSNVTFENTPTNKKDYASKRLPYNLEKGDISAYDKIISTLYSEEERRKIEWAVGSIINGDSKYIQKFLVFYGASGTGKSTILNIIQKLFTVGKKSNGVDDGYFSTFDAKALGSASRDFALEPFKENPLVAIQHDGDLSRIEDNTRLNSLVSHEMMTVNVKNLSQYTDRFRSFLFMGTNKPVKITDAKSGLLRRLIDVSPTGNLIPVREYNALMKQVNFELGAIAYHCKEVYETDPGYFDNYVPIRMMDASNDFYNFIQEKYYVFKKDNATSLKSAWEMYNQYCDEAKVPYPFSQRVFKEELKNYFDEFYDRYQTSDGNRVRSYYVGFKHDIFKKKKKKDSDVYSIELRARMSLLDEVLSDCPAQYANDEGKPMYKWANVETRMSDLDTKQLHYVKVPKQHIVIDFDIPDENGEKDLAANLAEASKWPPTYSELSKSEKGVHLHYIYNGDVTKLAREYADHIEIKVFTGNSSLRRKLTKCNDIQIATLSSGLPLKGEEKKLVKTEHVKDDEGLHNFIKKCLNKDHHGATKPEIDFIKAVLDDFQEKGIHYDISDMESAITTFAASSSNQAEYCLKVCSEMKFKSDDESEWVDSEEKAFIFYDVEVFPNLCLVNWKFEGDGRTVSRLINPSREDIEELMRYRLIGFNCRRYDNHIIYAIFMGYDNDQIYNLSKKIIDGEKGAFFGEAYNISYTDVYDFSSKKQSLKKFEIELGIHHQELGLPWDKPVPKELWNRVAEYCDNDVIATEKVFIARASDFTARKILAALTDKTVNDTTNSLTTKLIFWNDKNPQRQFNYRNLALPVLEDDLGIPYPTSMLDFVAWDGTLSKMPCFPGYLFEFGKSTYRGEEVGEGGYVYAEPGMYGNVALLDVASMHPNSIINERFFGEYTDNYEDLVKARIFIKHKDFESARELFGGKLAPYLQNEDTAKDLAQALKIVINSVYGLTSAKFDNPFRDIRNKDNIVAKRGALFMIDLKHAVQERGFTVAHIKTDSIKIPDATPEIIEFVMEFGKKYGYTFEHEATYDRMCLVNDAVYIAKYQDGEWTATGTQFAVPYVFKTLFSHEPIEFKDLCETKEVKKGNLYLDMNENLGEGEHNYQFIGKVGSFCPIKEGRGGGVLYRESEGKYYAATGTKGFRWLEAEEVKKDGKEDDIDISYYDELVKKAEQTIIAYGDLEWFKSDRPYISPEFRDGHPIYPDPKPFE